MNLSMNPMINFLNATVQVVVVDVVVANVVVVVSN